MFAVRAVVAALPFAILWLAMSCGGEAGHPGGPAVPPGIGYGSTSASSSSDDLRVLSKDDCLALRDHQIEIAVGAALGDAGLDQGARLELEAKVRAEEKPRTDEWVKRCAGRAVASKTLRCWKEATTPATLMACDPVIESAPGADAAAG